MHDVPEQSAALAAGAARTIASYETFRLVEAAGRDAERLRAAGADERDDMRAVRLQGRAVDPAGRPPLVAKRGAAPRGERLVLVQFVGPVKDAWLARLRATGATVVTYMAQNAYLVHAAGDDLAALGRLTAGDPAVRAATAVGAADKLAPGVAARRGRAAFEVQTVAGARGASARRALADRGRALRATSRTGRVATQFVAADAAAVRELARDPAVVSVLPHVAPALRDERAAQIVAGNLTGGTAPSGTGYLAWLTAQGFGSGTFDFAVDVTDEGVDTATAPGAHPDFYEGGSTSNPTRIAYKTNWTTDADARDCGGHGTNVASIATGFNDGTGSAVEDADGFNYGLGVAPRARVGASKIFSCNGGLFDLTGTFTDLVDSAYANGARVSNNSWGADVDGFYTADSQEYDALVRDARPGVAGNQQIVEVFANGNAGPFTGSVGSPATAKNVISVGASENVRAGSAGCPVLVTNGDSARDVIGFSSRGPTQDGRVKPDVVAPGTHVTGAQPQTGADYNGSGTTCPQFPDGSTLYSLVSGTSQATPEASGFAALIRDHYTRTVGGGTTPPSPAMTKAIMVNGASDLAGGVDGGVGIQASRPNGSQGWGRIDAGSALDSTTRHHTDQTIVLGASGEANARTFTVADAARPVRVSLAWTDPPGPTSGDAFVNDLDLTVVAGGQTYKGNVLSSGQSVTGGTADPRNNVENVFLPAGVTGSMSVTVTATNVAGDGVPGNGDATDQDFALVVSNASQVPAPVLVHDETTATEAPGGDGDGVLEGGESVTLSERIRNAGDAGATGIAGTLTSSTSGGPATEVSSAFSTLSAGATATGAPPFQASIASSVPCGRELGFSLSLTRDGAADPVVVPLSVQTGAPGPAQAYDSTQVPRPIPDDDPAGVTSSVSVSRSGLVSDVNVRIGSLTHTWVGDMRIELTAPDGTTVTLMDSPGAGFFGSERDGFSNLVLDDEATTPIESIPVTDGPAVGGSFRPDGQLSAFDGRQLEGTWTLRVIDVEAPDVGTLNAWGTSAGRFVCGGENDPPTASFTVAPGTVATGQAVTLDGSGSSDPDGPLASYAWDLDGDGSFERSTGAVPSLTHSFSDDGIVNVGLRVTDAGGLTATASRTVTVTNRAPSARFEISSALRAGEPVRFDASGSSDPDGSVARYEWDFDGNGSHESDAGAAATATRTYAQPMTLNVGLRVTDDDGASALAAQGLTIGAARRDVLGPLVSLEALGRLRIRSLLARRVRIAGGCDEACTLTVRLLARVRDRRTGRVRTIVLARASRNLSRAGTRTLRLLPTRAGRAVLRRARGLRARLELRGVDAAGNPSVARQTVQLRR